MAASEFTAREACAVLAEVSIYPARSGTWTLVARAWDNARRVRVVRDYRGLADLAAVEEALASAHEWFATLPGKPKPGG